MLVDVNLLVYAAMETSPFHAHSREWFNAALNGDERVALPWESITGFVRLASNPRLCSPGFSVREAWRIAELWLDCGNVWIPTPTREHRAVFRHLIGNVAPMTHKLVADAHLAAIAIEHNLALVSADTDFAKFSGLRYHNPLQYEKNNINP